MEFTNFNDAWDAWSLNLDTTYWYHAIGLSYAYEARDAPTWAEAQPWIADSLINTLTALYWHALSPLSFSTPMENQHYATVWFAGQGTVDMDAIINAMLLATPEQLTKFVGIEQAYMAAIWNAPYNHEYYAALARGFRQWP